MTTERMKTFNQNFHPVSGRILLGHKGMVARSNKTIVYVRTECEAIKMLAKHGKNRVKIEIFPSLEDIR